MAQASGTIDVAGFIDEQPVGRFQIRLLLACAAVLFLDGFDTQAIGYVAPDSRRAQMVAAIAASCGRADVTVTDTAGPDIGPAPSPEAESRPSHGSTSGS